MPLALIGLSHNTGATVEVREKIAFTTPGTLAHALHFLKTSLEGQAEAVLLSTCNRTELYIATSGNLSDDEITELLLEARGIAGEAETICPYLRTRHGHQAIEHLFRVSAGLDSMIIGESDVVRQVRDAYSSASHAGICGKTLNQLFHEALRVGKQARTESDLGRGAFSIGHAAAEVARNIFGVGRGQTVLLLGAGKMSETTARHLTAGGAATVLVANRTYDRAVHLAEALNGRAIRYDEFADYLAKVDIVISSTSAPHPIVTREVVEPTLRHRRRGPLFLIDIAVPRDVESTVGELPDVYLYDIDDLQQLVEEDMAERRKRAVQAEAFVRDEALAFAAKLRTQSVAVPLVSSMRAKVRTITAMELTKLRQRLPHLSDDDWQTIEATFASVENRLLHDPTLRVKEYAAAAENPEVEAKMATVRELFGLEQEENARRV